MSFNRNFCNLSEQGGVLENSSEMKVSVFRFYKVLDDFTKFEMRFAHAGCASRILDALRAFGMRFAHLRCASRILDALRAFDTPRFARLNGPRFARPTASLRSANELLGQNLAFRRGGEGGVKTLLKNYGSLNKNSPSDPYQK